MIKCSYYEGMCYKPKQQEKVVCIRCGLVVLFHGFDRLFCSYTCSVCGTQHVVVAQYIEGDRSESVLRIKDLDANNIYDPINNNLSSYLYRHINNVGKLYYIARYRDWILEYTSRMVSLWAGFESRLKLI